MTPEQVMTSIFENEKVIEVCDWLQAFAIITWLGWLCVGAIMVWIWKKGGPKR